jgi:hypothetical protein
MTRPVLAILLALAALPAAAAQPPGEDPDKYSAAREKTESFAHARDEFWQKVRGTPYSPAADSGPLQAAVPLDRLDLSRVPSWPDAAALEGAFAGVRDERRFQHPRGFARRLTWLYPDDGCFARAALMADMAEEQKLPRPRKVFIFGELEVRTANAPGGTVSWWYHVAPIVSVGGRAYVLDPAIEPRRPLPLEEWAASMQLRSRELKLAVCSEHAYTPSSPCLAERGADSIAGKNINEYLPREWERVRALGGDPAALLGDSPPWPMAAAPVRSTLPGAQSERVGHGLRELSDRLQGSAPPR